MYNNTLKYELQSVLFNYIECRKLIRMNRIKKVLPERSFKQSLLRRRLEKWYAQLNFYAKNRKQIRLDVLHQIAEIVNKDIYCLIRSNKEIEVTL